MSVASTYAEALHQSAIDGNAVDEVRRDLAGFTEAVAESDDLARVLNNPEVETKAKRSIVADISEGATPIVKNFLQVLIDRGRISELPAIRQALEERVAAAAGRVDVHVITAIPLDDALRQRIVARIAEETGLTVDLTEDVDPDIVGGLVMRVGGVVLDSSVRNRLAELRRQMASAPVDTAVNAA
ncbi:MAG: ATP synthase F1 subunit delta [Thermoleophilia bacterium]